MSRVLPILFNTDMVRAILDGRKTVTRRIIKPQIPNNCPHCMYVHNEFIYDTNAENVYCARCGEPLYNGGIAYKPPYQQGDILWVQETWKILDALNELSMKFEYRADGKISGFIDFIAERMEKFRKFANKNGWQSPYFMPKEAARIFLKVKDVRVERLQDMEPVDVIKEGAYPDCCDCLDTYGESGSQCCYKTKDECSQCDSVMMEWEKLWNSTIKKSDLDRYGWDASPWVWVIEFERCEKTEEI